MASDYERIRAENIEEYGRGTRHLAFLGQLYTDRTHFIFELLQNAEDAGAHTVTFELYSDRLKMWHDGRLFDEDDVRGVCGVGDGTKAGDLTKIGKFGIGFKSVYAYTSNPEIHSGTEHFRIEHYVRPYETAPRDPKSTLTTLFVFPFDHDEISPSQARHEIGTRLRELNVRTLLFLHHISEITWNLDGVDSGFYMREEKPVSSMRRVHVIGQSQKDIDEEEWLLCKRLVTLPETEIPVQVEAAFLVVTDEKTGADTIVRASNTDLVVSFPTEKETHLGFLIQGPYRTTPSRDNVSAADVTNKRLIQETAGLIGDTLPLLRDAGLLTVSLLDAMPIRSADFPSYSMFRPIFDQIRHILREQDLLPTNDGSHIAATSAKLARGVELLALLPPPQLSDLLGCGRVLKWLSEEITENTTPDLYRYLVGRAPRWHGDADGADGLAPDIEVRPQTLVRALTSTFLVKQSDEWVEQLYGFLAGQRGQWQFVRDKEILRLSNGTLVAPLRSDGCPNAYLPTYQVFDLPFVKRETVSKPQALQFLRDLGLTEPDLVAVVAEKILPKYEGTTINVQDEEHEDDLRKILATLEIVAGSSRIAWIERLKETPFIRVANAGDGVIYFAPPIQTYIRNTELERYFCESHDAYFLDEPSIDKVPEGLYELGVSGTVRVHCTQSNSAGHVVVCSRPGAHERGLNGFDPTFTIDGLEHALSNPDEHWSERTAYIWNNFLIPYKQQIRGEVETSTRQDYSNAKRTERLSSVGQLVTRIAWLPQGEECQTPDKLALDDLPPWFERDEMLAQALGMKPAALATLARSADVPVEHLQFMRAHQDAFERFMRDILTQEHQAQVQPNISDAGVGFNYGAELHEAFSRPKTGEPEMDGNSAHTSKVSHPERWRSKAKTEIEQAQQNEPLVQTRFARVPQNVWEAKNSDVRIFLQEEYDGRCQICDGTFAKRDGTPYFEGLYLVRRTHTKWIDREGNVLCLCATCCAKMLYGPVDADDILSQVQAFRSVTEGGDGHPVLQITLGGSHTQICYTERHMMFLQELVKAALARTAVG